MAEEAKNPIIIKKVKKGHGGHHGGSWKVAYADFVTAMMAFFLLLWLLSMVSEDKKAVMSMYFKNFNLFEKGGQSIMAEPSNIGIISGQPKQNMAESQNDGTSTEVSARDLARELTKAVEEKLAEVRDQILIDRVEGGVRIQIVDKDGASMFPSGSAAPNPRAIEILQVVAESLKSTTRKIAVEGHTDAAPFRGSQITNWELSTSRASAARIELEKCGIAPARIARVVGYADTDLLIKTDPLDARNRRMSIIVLDGERPEKQPEAKPIRQPEVKPIIDPALQPSPTPPRPEARQPGGAKGAKSNLISKKA